MEIKKELDGSKLTVHCEGRIDTMTAPAFEAELQNLDGVTDVVLDLKELTYISSAGLRVLLQLSKVMSKKGSVSIVNVNDVVKEIFDITGFSDIFEIK